MPISSVPISSAPISAGPSASPLGPVITDTLDAIASNFTGIRYIVVRAVYGGVEEGNNNVLQIEYDNGVVVLPRPNAPYISGDITVDGLDLTVPYALQAVDSPGVPYEIQIFIQTANPAVTPFNYASPDATAVLPTQLGNSYNSTITVTAGIAGAYYVALKTATAGGTLSSNVDYIGPIQLETTAPPDPVLITVLEGA